MQDAGHLLTNRDFQRVGDALRRVESNYNAADASGESRGGSNVQVLQIQSGASNSFGYPARIQKWSNSAGTWSDLSTTEVRVEDPNGGSFAAGAYVPKARFLGVNSSNVGCFSAIASTYAAFIRFTLPGALAVTDASKASCTVDDFWGGTSPGATVTVYNLPASSDYIFAAISGSKGVAVYDEIDNKYWIIQLECGTIPVISVNETEVNGGDTNGLIYTDGSLVQTASGTRVSSEKLELKLDTDRWIAFSKGSY